MSFPTPKLWVLNFRITESESLHLRKATEVSGARSISEYARSVLLEALESNPCLRNQNLSPLLVRISHLENCVDGIADAIRTLQADGTPKEPGNACRS